MKTIHKFLIAESVRGDFQLQLPSESEVLHVGLQRGQPHMWILLDDAAPKQTWSFQVALTGGDATHFYKRTYLGSFVLENDGFVGHVFLLVHE